MSVLLNFFNFKACITRVSQKVKELLKKKIYCKYIETKLTLLFNVINLTATHSTSHYIKPVLPPFLERN